MRIDLSLTRFLFLVFCFGHELLLVKVVIDQVWGLGRI